MVFATAFRGPRSGVVCHRERRRLKVFVGLSEKLLSRTMDEVVYGSREVKVFTFPKTIRRVWEYAFRENKDLRRVRLNEDLEKVGKRAFAESGLRAFAAPPSLREIGKDAFINCKCLQTIALNEGLEEVDGHAFAYSGVEEVFVPASVRKIREYTFCGCRGLREIRLASDSRLECVGKYAFACSGLRAFTAPPALKTIEGYTFYYCKGLRAVVLNEGLEEVRAGAFAESGLEEIIVPASVREIGDRAF